MSALRDWQGLFLLEVIFAAIAVTVFVTIEAVAGDLPHSDALTDKGLWATLVTAVLLAPVIEELVFRGWLPGKRVQLVGLLCAMMLPALLVLLRLRIGPTSGAQNLLAIIAWAVASAVILAGATERSNVPAEYVRCFPLILWLSNTIFATAHILNYKDDFTPILLFMVVPQFIGGTILAYARLRISLRASMLMHGSFNGLAVLLVFSSV